MKNSYRKQNIINEDINRMREIMGLSPLNEHFFAKGSTLNEQNLFQPLFKSLRNTARKILLPSIEPVVANDGTTVNTFIVAGKKVPQKIHKMFDDLLNAEGDEFMRAYQKLTTPLETETELEFMSRIRNLIQILGSEFSTEFYNEFMKSWFKKTAGLFPDKLKSEKAFYRWMSNARKKAIKDGREWNLSTWLGPEPQGVGLIDDTFDLEVLKPTFERRLKEFDESPVAFKTEVVKKAEKFIPSLRTSQIEYLEKFLKSRSTIFTSAFKSWGITLQEYEDVILGLMESYANDVATAMTGKATQEQLNILSTAYAQKTALILRKAQLKFGDDALQILDDAGLPKDILAHFRGNTEEFFRYFNQALQTVNTPALTQLRESFVDSVRTFFKNCAEMISLLWKKEFKKFFSNLYNPNTPVGTWFWTRTWAGFDTLYQIAGKNALLSKNPKWVRAFVEALVWTQIASLMGFVANMMWEAFKELVFKPLGLLAEWGCNLITYLWASAKYYVDPNTGEVDKGVCLLLDDLNNFERDYEDIILYLPYDAFIDAFNKSPYSKGPIEIAINSIPIVSQVVGAYRQTDYTIKGFRTLVEALKGKPKEKQEELKKVTKEASNGEVNADNIELPDVDSVALELEQQ